MFLGQNSAWRHGFKVKSILCSDRQYSWLLGKYNTSICIQQVWKTEDTHLVAYRWKNFSKLPPLACNTWTRYRIFSAHLHLYLLQDISELPWPLQIHTLGASQPRSRKGEGSIAIAPSCASNLPFTSYGDVAQARRYFASILHAVAMEKHFKPTS
jgi:hypothetical protein